MALSFVQFIRLMHHGIGQLLTFDPKAISLSHRSA